MNAISKKAMKMIVRDSVVIVPIDDEVAAMANAINILNEFKIAGFMKREVFVETVMDEDTKYHNLSGMNKLNNFWAGRMKDAELNKDLVRILEKLKVS